MLPINNPTPYQAKAAAMRDRDGGEILVVAVKGTYLVLPNGDTELAPEQLPIVEIPKFLADPAALIPCEGRLPDAGKIKIRVAQAAQSLAAQFTGEHIPVGAHHGAQPSGLAPDLRAVRDCGACNHILAHQL